MNEQSVVDPIPSSLSIRQFLDAIRDPIRRTFAGQTFTVYGDILEANPWKDGLFVKLVDKTTSKEAYLTAFIPPDVLRNSGPVSKSTKILITGTVTVIRNEVQLHATYIQDLGAGEMHQLINQWTQKYLYLIKRNKKTLPLFCARVAIISNPDSQGYGDFITHLDYGAKTLFTAKMQGPEAATSIASAIYKANELGKYDCICIVRGGGSQAELFEYHRPELLEAIGNSKIPVLTGVGHEADIHLCDQVADYNCATPTALANYMNDKALSLLGEANGLMNDIARNAERIRNQEKNKYRTRQIIVASISIIAILLYALYRQSH